MLFIDPLRSNRSSRRAMTLTEIIIAAIIVSAVLLAIASVGLTIKKMSKNVNSESSMYMQLSGMAEHVRYSAMKAVGDSSSIGIGTSMPVNNGNSNWICFRLNEQLNETPNADDSITNYDDDTWRCYSKKREIGNNGGIATDRINFITCKNAVAGLCNAASTNSQILGQLVYDNFDTSAASPRFVPSFDKDGDHYFTFQLISRRNNADGAVVSGGVLTKGTEDNPQAFVEYRVFPEAHSF